ncbi:MAG: hypothetical protein QGG40_00195 [Myxococcota bacterium]|nr:hypothetical protein [Myxococcota bacterium]
MIGAGLAALIFGSLTSLAAGDEPTTQEVSSPTEVATDAPASADTMVLEADLRKEYLAGSPVVMSLTLANDGTRPVLVPDLSSRPWMVRFNFEWSNGKSQSRFTTPPSQDPGSTVTIPPRGRRRTTLEVPSGSTLAEGAVDLVIEVDLDGAKLALPAHSLLIRPASSVGGDLGRAMPGAGGQGVLGAWVHQASEGYDVYLHHSDGLRLRENRFALHLEQPVSVQLTQSRGVEFWNRHLYWREGDRKVWVTRLQGRTLRDQPRVVQLPWPSVDTKGPGATDGGGRFHLVLWVPSPRGDRGELRLLSVDGLQAPSFRKMARMNASPRDVRTVVDSTGKARFLVLQDSFLDVYGAHSDLGDEFPLSGRRLWVAPEGQVLVDAGFEVMEHDVSGGGGLAVWLVSRSGEELEGAWVDTRGNVLRSMSLPTIEPGDEPLAVLPAGSRATGLLLRGTEGRIRYVEADRSTVISELPKEWSLFRDATGQVVLRSHGGPAGIQARVIDSGAPTNQAE